MLINGERSLAYITTLDEIRPIEGYDRVEYGRTNGWWCIINKADNMKVGDKVVYFEVDSLCPSTDKRFAFLEKRKFRIKTLKMCKVVSQGLIMPLSAFDEISEDVEVNTDVSKLLNIVYYEPEDNQRKAKAVDPNAKYKAMSSRHANLAKKKWWRWLMKRDWGKKLLFIFFGKKRDAPLRFPTHFEFVHKTDEERVENMPFILEDKQPWVKTQKLDGTSATYILEKIRKNKYEYYVCSRNVRQKDRDQKNFHSDMGVEDNVYWEISDKYHIYDFLKDHVDDYGIQYVAIQGEIVGPSIQGNPHKFKEREFYGFNLIDSARGRYPSLEGEEICNAYSIKWVPIVDDWYTLPDDMEEFKLSADGECEVGEGLREGYVYRSQDGQKSFKNVSREYLLKK